MCSTIKFWSIFVCSDHLLKLTTPSRSKESRQVRIVFINGSHGLTDGNPKPMSALILQHPTSISWRISSPSSTSQGHWSEPLHKQTALHRGHQPGIIEAFSHTGIVGALMLPCPQLTPEYLSLKLKMAYHGWKFGVLRAKGKCSSLQISAIGYLFSNVFF